MCVKTVIFSLIFLVYTAFSSQESFKPYSQHSKKRNHPLFAAKESIPVKKNENLLPDIPTSFDAREKWPYCRKLMGQIRNQEQCAGCWAYAAAAMISHRTCIDTKGRDIFDVSEQDIVECANPVIFGCEGDWFETALEYYIEHGVVTKECKPVEETATGIGFSVPCRRGCTNLTYRGHYNRDRRFGGKMYYVTTNKTGSVRDIQHEIMINGPVLASFCIYDDLHDFDSSTIYVHRWGENFDDMEHGVVLIGWGVENGVLYWLILNSYGESYGNKGYFKMRRDTNEAGLEDWVLAVSTGGLPRLPGLKSVLSSASLVACDFFVYVVLVAVLL